MASERRRVLVVAYYFPPSGGPGVQRTLKMVKYLPEFGWDPVVLTVRDADWPARDVSLLAEIPSDIPVIRTSIPEPYALYRRLTGKKPGQAVDVEVNRNPGEPAPLSERLTGWVRGALFVPDARVGWLLTGTGPGVRAAREHGVDLVTSSSPPYTTALLGRRIARKVGVPWVPEFRDPWSGFLSAAHRPALSASFEKRLERGVYEDADRMVVAWRGIERDFEAKFGADDSNRVRLVENGYDPEDLVGVTPKSSDRFTLVYTGSMYGVRNPDTLLRAVARLVEDGRMDPRRVRLRFVGRFGSEVQEMFRRPEVAGMIEERPYVPHAESVAELLGAHVLLLVVDDFVGAEGIVPGKVYEYIGAKRPLLALAPPGAVADLVSSTGAGTVCGQQDVEAVGEALVRLYDEWQATGTTAFPGIRTRWAD